MHGPLFLLELGGVVLLLAVLARLAGRFGFSPIPLYLLAGLAFGEGGIIPLVTAETFVGSGATIGLVLLLFSLGLEYSADDLVRSLKAGAPAGAVDLVLNSAPGFCAGLLLGWDVLPAVLLGGVTYISSSGVAARILDELGWMRHDEVRVVLGVLVTEDLVMAIFLPIVSILITGGRPAEIAVSIGLAGVLVLGVLGLASRYGDVLSRVVAGRSDEAFLLALLGIMLVVSGTAEAVNVSAAVGAFLTGIVFSGPVAERARDLVRPLRDVFAGAFFIFFGFQVDPSSIPPVALPAVALATIGVVSKVLTGWWAARHAGFGPRGRRRAGLALIARGEFSIVIAGLGVAAGLEPKLGPLAATYVLLLAVVGPLGAYLVHRAEARGTPPA